MRRLALVVATAIALPAAARAQACLGSVSFANVPVRIGGGMIFGQNFTAYAASLIAGKDNGPFGDVGVARIYDDEYEDTEDRAFVEFGLQRAMGQSVQLCPVLGASLGTGPNDDGYDVKSRFASAGLALGFTYRPVSSVKIIPNGSLRYEYSHRIGRTQAARRKRYRTTGALATSAWGSCSSTIGSRFSPGYRFRLRRRTTRSPTGWW